MRVLVVYCHPCKDSFTAAVCARALAALAQAGHEVRVLDLYAMGFDPIMQEAERRAYHTPGANERPVAEHLAELRWAQGLLFVYPTWWYGLPAMLKGWLDRVWIPHATFAMPKGNRPIGRMLTNITHIAAISTLGSPRWWWWWIGAPGRRTLLTGLSVLCHPRCRTAWVALHRIDAASGDKRDRFLTKVHRTVLKFYGSVLDSPPG